MTFSQVLTQHERLKQRRIKSEHKLEEARAAFFNHPIFEQNKEICVFAAGSLGRLESGEKSDLDVFVTTTDKAPGRLREIEVFSAILNVNESQGFPELSNDGQFLKIFGVGENEKKIGSPYDDNENWFTTRMLLLLESNYLCNRDAYDKHKEIVLQLYFRDSSEQPGFKPVFLLNDILRYWRTLCLNYELARAKNNQSWKKKNLNLRFSRLLTVFGTVLPLMLLDEITVENVMRLTSLTPMERLAQGLDKLEGGSVSREQFQTLLDNYEDFLTTKEQVSFEDVDPETRENLKDKAGFIAQFVYSALNDKSVPEMMRRYLVI